MTFKKVLSAVMAGAMVLSVGMTAFATSTPNKEDAEPYELYVEGQTKVPAVKLVVPESAGIIVNPYRLTVDATEIGGSNSESGQIISPTQYIENLSDVAVEVKIQVTGDCAESVSFATATPADAEKKEAFIQLNAELVANKTAALTAGADKTTVSTTATDANSGNAFEMKAAGGDKPCLALGFTGEVQDAPKEPWTEDDVFNANLAFTFVAKANAATP